MYGITNSGSGAGSGFSSNNAVLHVKAPFGSTVSISKNGIVTKTLGPGKAHANIDGVDADYYFSITPSNYGIWVVTSALNGDSASDTVTVNANQQYDVTLSYCLYVYRRGDERSSASGGWAGNGTFAKNTDSITSNLADSGDYGNVYTNSLISFADYRSLVFVFSGTISVGSGGTNLFMWAHTSKLSNSNMSAPTGAVASKKVGGNNDGQITLGTYAIDVSALTGSYYVGFHTGRGGGTGDGWTDCKLLAVYLSK